MKQVIGHESQLSWLHKLLSSGRVPHSLLFTGPDGIGKYTAALHFGQSLVCEAQIASRPCGECPRCRLFTQHRLMDVIELAGDDAAVKVGQPDEPGTVRHLVSRLTEKSVSGGYVVLIKGMERINESGQNVLLKTIEEPGEGTHIIMTAPSKSSVLQTIRSRSVQLGFFPLRSAQIQKILAINPQRHSLEEASVIASGGSVTLAKKLLADGSIEQILNLAAEMKHSIEEETGFRVENVMPEKELKELPVIPVLINCFRYITRVIIKNDIRYNRYMEKLYIDDIQTLHSLIKCLLQVQKDQRFNVNSRNALKSTVYTIIEGHHKKK